MLVTLLSSCGGSDYAYIDRVFSEIVESYGGKTIVYEPFSGGEAPSELTVLYGRDGATPDEFSLIEYMQVWYSERPMGGDAAVFYAVNATDTPSIVKMCERRARTLKYSAGIESEVFVSGHYVVFVNCSGELEDIGVKLRESFGE